MYREFNSIVGDRDYGARKIRICFIVPAHWDSLMGGSQYQAKLLIEHLLTLGRYDIYYLARRVNQEHTPLGYQIIKISDNTGFRRYGYFIDAHRLLKLLKEIRPDVIYQMVGSAYTGISAYYAKQYGCRLIWRITSDNSVQKKELSRWRDLLPHKYIERIFTQYGISNAESIVAQTNHQARLLRENYGRVAAAVIRNYHPVPKAEVIRKTDPIKVLWIANLKRLKQPEIFIRLAEDLRRYSRVRFIMIGAPAPGEKWFHQLIKRASSLSNLEYLGVQTQNQVNALLAQSQILVNTSQYEGFSNTFIQAWMHQVAVVSLNANPDNLLDSGSLGYCASGDYERLLESVRKLLDNPGLIDEIGINSRHYALESHSERNILELVKLIGDVKYAESHGKL